MATFRRSDSQSSTTATTTEAPALAVSPLRTLCTARGDIDSHRVMPAKHVRNVSETCVSHCAKRAKKTRRWRRQSRRHHRAVATFHRTTYSADASLVLAPSPSCHHPPLYTRGPRCLNSFSSSPGALRVHVLDQVLPQRGGENARVLGKTRIG